MTETGRCCWQLLIQGRAHGRQNIADSGSVVCGNFYLLAQGEQFVTKETRKLRRGGGGVCVGRVNHLLAKDDSTYHRYKLCGKGNERHLDTPKFRRVHGTIRGVNGFFFFFK